MKNLILKSIFFFAFLSFTTLSAQQFNGSVANSSGRPIRVIVFDASNNQILNNVYGAGTTLIVCLSGVPSYIHFIEVDEPFPGCGLGGCLWSANLNTSGSCSTCTSCNCWTTTSPTFSNTFAASTFCAPIAYTLNITIAP